MIYIHVPFCASKCPYCDFYSLPANEGLMEGYTEEIIKQMGKYKDDCITAHTVYFGGGTPSIIGAKRLARLLDGAAQAFHVSKDAEITVEVNPTIVDYQFFCDLHESGVSRISMGMQSANDSELTILGRKHNKGDVAEAVRAAQAAGFENISLDLMLGLPNSGELSLKKSIEYAAELGVQHISSYILKLEENTPFYKMNLNLPNDEETAGQYLFCVEELKKHGYIQYEISNFAQAGYESKHNLIYWHDEEYLGFGPSAHSFYQSRRFYCPRDMEAFFRNERIDDGEGGSFEEFVMLGLRLNEGITRERVKERFENGDELFEGLLSKSKELIKSLGKTENPQRLLNADNNRIHLTEKGFLLSNTIIEKLID